MEKHKITVEELAAQEWFQNYCLELEILPVEEQKNLESTDPQIIEEAKKMVRLLTLHPTDVITQQEWQYLSTHLNQRQKPATVRKISFHFRLAAAVLILAVAAFGLWKALQPNWQIEQTAFGENKTILLADGSQIKLNSNSSVKFREDWKWSRTRAIHLQGEAYFEVEKDEKAFVVQTEKGAIWVLGTTFNVEQRANELGVTLVEGKVKLAIPKHEPLEMKPETSVFLDEEGEISYQRADFKTELAWIDNKMAFSKVKIEEIVAQFKAEFNIDLQVKVDSLLERKVSATIPENNPELLLQALGEIYDLEVKKIDESTYSLE
ncbi:MAG: FecR domain-containing protein [Bacteroidota bacterium]